MQKKKNKTEHIVSKRERENLFAHEKVSAQDKGGEKHFFFKKKKRRVKKMRRNKTTQEA